MQYQVAFCEYDNPEPGREPFRWWEVCDTLADPFDEDSADVVGLFDTEAEAEHEANRLNGIAPSVAII